MLQIESQTKADHNIVELLDIHEMLISRLFYAVVKVLG